MAQLLFTISIRDILAIAVVILVMVLGCLVGRWFPADSKSLSRLEDPLLNIIEFKVGDIHQRLTVILGALCTAEITLLSPKGLARSCIATAYITVTYHGVPLLRNAPITFYTQLGDPLPPTT